MKHRFPLLLVLTLIGASTATAQDLSTCSDYLAGFVRDPNNQAVVAASVVITDGEKKLFSLKTGAGGWFETPVALSSVSSAKTFNLVALKRAYRPAVISVHVQPRCEPAGPDAALDVRVTPIADILVESDDETFPLKVWYGYVFDTNSGEPVRNTVVNVIDQIDGAPVTLASAMSRNSGFFTLYYDRTLPTSAQLWYQARHSDYTSELKTLDTHPPLLPVALSRVRHHFSWGIGWHVQNTGKQSDKESGGALTANIAWFPDGQLLLDADNNVYLRRRGIVGYDLSIGVIPFREERPGADTVGEVFTLGAGIIFDSVTYFTRPIQFRLGLTTSDTGKQAFYLGLGVPLHFF